MATVGSKNQPIIVTTDTFNPVTDINNGVNWSATFANVRNVASATARNALSGADLWQGLSVYQVDTGEFYTYNGTAWQLGGGLGVAPRIELTRTATQTSTTATATTQTGWTQTAIRGGFTEASGVVTIPRTGKYNIFLQVNWAANATGHRALSIVSGGSPILRASGMTVTTSSTETNLQVTGLSIPLASGATLTPQALQTSGGALNTTGATVPMKFIVEWASE